MMMTCDVHPVHGTWVCGKKIAPGIPVELLDGDILQLGASSRIYRLHWIPLSQAYDYDNPFVPMIKGQGYVEEKEEMQQVKKQTVICKKFIHWVDELVGVGTWNLDGSLILIPKFVLFDV